MQHSRTYTLQEYIDYRNKVVARARAVGFKRNRYYAIRLEQLDNAYPEFAKLGIIETAESKELSQGIKEKIEASIRNDEMELAKVLKDIQELEQKKLRLESDIQFKHWTLKK